jgi:YesN/AraC family two-component response regulator
MDEKLRLMIVDDNPHARKALSAFISTQDWLEVITEASNGDDAVRKIRDQRPDMILMDIQMPVMDGLKATQIIKEHWPRIKVVILTIYADYRLQAKQVGADAFLVKGCSMEEMTSTIRSLSLN